MSFWNEGYRAFAVNSFYDNPYEHSVQDTSKHVNFPFLKRMTAAALAAAVYLATAESPEI